MPSQRTELIISWNDVHRYAKAVARKIRAAGFVPDLILGSAGPSTIAAILIGMCLDEEIPIHVMQQKVATDRKGEMTSGKFRIDGLEAHTVKWRTLVPQVCAADTVRRVLVVHDAALTGHTLMRVRGRLLAMGLKEGNVRTAALLCVRTASPTDEPDFYARGVDATRIRMPWGEVSRWKRVRRQKRRRGETWPP
jgi:hypoxanthine phosphoribosyltransferase